MPTNLDLPSNRKFGSFFAAIFATLGVYAYLNAWADLTVFLSVIGTLFAAIALIAPQLLNPLNRLWYKLGLLLGKIVSPIVLGLIFFVLITPISLITRLFGRDELKMKKRSVDSYWVHRPTPGPPSDSFKNQY